MVREFEHKNQWALILGGSTGLGLATAKKLAMHGLNICIIHRNSRSQQKEIEQDFDEIRAHNVDVLCFNKDLLNTDKQEQILESFQQKLGEIGKVKVVVHSIAKGNLKPMNSHNNSLKNDDFLGTINAMAVSLYDWTKLIFDAKLFDSDARVLSFTSEGNSKAWPSYAAVSAAKSALEAITRNIALEFAPYGIKANCIQAGVTDTQSLRLIPGSDQIKAHSLKRNPFKRLTTPKDVADVVYLLSKDEAKWITGTVIPVDGGEHMC